MKHTFIAWINFQRRIESMQPHFGYSIHYVPSPVRARWLKPFGYVRQLLQTMRIIRRERTDVLWLQLPPTFLLLGIAVIRILTGYPRNVIADCHNRVFRAPWDRMPGLKGQLKRSLAVLVHNHEIAAEARATGMTPDRTFVLEDPPAILQPPTSPNVPTGAPAILVPCSFNPDEPIENLLAAAAMAPDLHFLVTGNVAKARAAGYVDKAPDNVTFTGFLPRSEFEELVFTSRAVLGLTSLEGIQLSVANEAVGARKALVLSDTRILRELFGDAALFCHNTTEGIATACRQAIADSDALDARSARLRETRNAIWLAQAQKLTEFLNDALAAPQPVPHPA